MSAEADLNPFHSRGITLEILHQDQSWTDASGGEHLVADMSKGYLGNVKSFLEQRSEDLYQRQCDADGNPLPEKPDHEEGFLIYATGWDWLQETSLLTAIKARLAELEETR